MKLYVMWHKNEEIVVYDSCYLTGLSPWAASFLSYIAPIGCLIESYGICYHKYADDSFKQPLPYCLVTDSTNFNDVPSAYNCGFGTMICF